MCHVTLHPSSLSLQVAIEAMDKKTKDFALVLNMDPPDLKRIQLLLGGSISTQVNQGVQEYIAFFRDGVHFPQEHIEQLKQIYRLESYIGHHNHHPQSIANCIAK